MKKLVILVFSCVLQFTHGSEPNIDGTIIANAKSPMDRRDPRLFFGVSFVLIFNVRTEDLGRNLLVSDSSLIDISDTF